MTDLQADAGGLVVDFHDVAVTSQPSPLLLGWPHLEKADVRIFSKEMGAGRRRGMVQFGKGRPMPTILVSRTQFLRGETVSALTVEGGKKEGGPTAEDFWKGPLALDH